jgi:hypothetical protein
MRAKPLNRKLAQIRPDGSWNLRIFHRAARDKKAPRYLVKCGCCDQSVEIYYDDDSLEINGVNASIENWRELLLPLLKLK